VKTRKKSPLHSRAAVQAARIRLKVSSGSSERPWTAGMNSTGEI